MGVVLLGLGSRGDVQPMAVLAAALARAGVDARVVGLAEYAPLAAGLGAAYVPVAGSVADAMRRTPTRELLGGTPPGQALLLRRWGAGLADAFADAVLATVRRDDLVLAGNLARGVATAVAEAHGVKMATVVYTGQAPTTRPESFYFHRWLTGWPPYDRWGARQNWILATNVAPALTHTIRGRLGLPRRSAARETEAADTHPTLVAASPVVVPPAPDWAGGVHQTGWLAPPASALAPDAELAAFLHAGPASYVGFGSFGLFSTRRELDLIAAAATASGRRIVTPAIPGVAPGPITDAVLAIGSVPHDWLFPRLAGVVHHGGAGTTHAGLAAAVPSVAVPFGVDQPYHGWRLHSLGVGPEPVRIQRLTAARLACLLVALERAEHRRGATEVGERVRGEDGVAVTLAALERLRLV